MSNKVKTIYPSENLTGEKYLNKLLRLEHTQAARKGVVPRQYNEKLSHIVKQPNVTLTQKAKPKPNPVQRGPMTQTGPTTRREPEVQNKAAKNQKRRNRSTSPIQGDDRDREVWGQILMSNNSKEKVSNFSNFDPLRTVHFLSKELKAKLKLLDPDNQEVLQMVTDIQHALKRIPPEVSTLLHNPIVEY